MSVAPTRIDPARAEPDHEPAIVALREALNGLRFGTIALTVHDGRIVQLEITEKRRFGA
ncbi:YezD family protein [Hephaestia mangrovi]|uniref:YezD family protein n=1 Tax=Hephaestia mangrovi TaxID=2873268 RepID=UPI001CA77DFB|nr:YezD family protein [Hephaestia mangrovi]MBY8826561.1 YezD family protein [Hephaestia mangrovi]